MKYLNVAEKNDAAKTIAGLLSKGTSRRREGISPYNKIYEFNANVLGQNVDMTMTSVSGHLLTHAFVQSFKNWRGCDPIALFDAPVIKVCPDDYVKVKETIQREIRKCSALIIWTDCDREGENIGFEIIDVCQAIKPNIPIYRAKFSEITAAGIHRALNTIGQPDRLQSLAVDVRCELDLRIGAAFTRFQTLRFQGIFPSLIENKLVSYGSCQIPTLGFVAQRYKEIENFIPQIFWKLKLIHKINDLTVEFTWDRNRLFDKQCCEALFMLCQLEPEATVLNVTNKPKNKWRPLPMDTIELEKLGSRKLKINAKATMTIAEKLYQKGLISYPRTETNIFSSDINLRSLVEQHTSDAHWGAFAAKVLNWGPNPRKGTKSDQAHPPIHPTKFTADLHGNEQRVYELICRHFLACVSRDATGSETIVNVTVANEQFTATGLCIYERNYLEVYIYDKWSGKEIHNYEIGKKFQPTDLTMNEGSTTAPSMLTEAELIALMDKHGIGTDATHAEHINTIKEREYIGEINGGYLVPGNLGMGLVEGYDAMKLTLAQPKLRADLEKDLKLICSGERDPKDVLREQIEIYKQAYRVITAEVAELDRTLANRLNETPRNVPPALTADQQLQRQQPLKDVLKCPKCNRFSMVLKTKKDNPGSYFLSCLGFPDCKHAIWLVDMIKEMVVTDEGCPKCGTGFHKLAIKFKQPSALALLNSTNSNTYTSCIVCDINLRNLLNISMDEVKRNPLQMITAANTSNTNFNSNSNNSISTAAPRPSNRNNNTNTNANNSNNNNNNNRTFGGSSSGFGGSGGGGGGGGDWGISTAATTTNNDNRIVNRNYHFNDNSGPSTSAGTNSQIGNNYRNNVNNNNNRNFNNNTNNNNRNNNNRQDDDDVNCKCNKKAIKFTVKRDGPNKGRPFYTCDGKTCNFFQWADGGDNNNSNNNNNGTSWGGAAAGSDAANNNNNNNNFSWGQPNNRTNYNRNQPATGQAGPSAGTTTTRAKRKCGICKQEGHTRNKCPRQQQQNNYDD